MKLHIACLALACLTLAAVPALAQGTVYDNGPVNGQVDGWIINFGYAVSETFQLANNSTVGGISFWAWLEPEDTASTVEVQLGSTGYYSNNLLDETILLTQSNCFTNNRGFEVCQESGNFAGPALNAGNYYLTLTNATTVNGDPVFWDENSGVGCQSPGCPSSAQEFTFGTIPSEAFTLGGSSSQTGTTPESSTIFLVVTGSFAVICRLRRKFF